MEALRIEVGVNRTTRRLETTWSANGTLLRDVPTALHEDELPELRAILGRSLQRAKDSLRSVLQPPWEDVKAAISELHGAGNVLMERLFPENARNVTEHWQRALAPSLQGAIEPPIITLTGRESGATSHRPANLLLPLEFLPLFRPVPPVVPEGTRQRRRAAEQTVDSHATLDEALKHFVGYRCIVSRVLASAGEQTSLNENDPSQQLRTVPRMAAKLFTNRTLSGAIEEEKRLRVTERHRLQIDAWPRAGKIGQARELAEFLWRTTHSTRGRKRPMPDQIHHFTSHFDTSSPNAEAHAIKLAGCGESEFQVTIFELESAIAELKFQGGPMPERGARPLVFVNACGSSQIDPRGITSLPELFLGKLRSRGFIGAETTMSDPVATEFAAEFYARLFQGATVGRALHDSRRALVFLFANPLGLFYTSYVHPALRLEQQPT